jgi:radical SAM enzyme (TIGR01210 family)
MSQPPSASGPGPEVYEQGKGMDAHNSAMRELRAENDATHATDEPTSVWLDEDRTPDGVVDSLTIVLNTGGCRWARAGGCTMCGYVAESTDDGTVSHGDLLAQVDAALDRELDLADDRCPQVKLYTSGSFLDEREVGPDTRNALAETFADRDRIVLESLPDFVSSAGIAPFRDRGLATDVAIGLETATDRIRHDCVNKYFDFDDFVAACDAARAADAGVKAYLLHKPPFLAEAEAVDDMVDSIRRCAGVEGCHTVSMNPCNVQRYTMADRLHHAGGYRPPWLWSVVRVLRETAGTDAIVVSDPVGAGSDRGPHNCGECDDRVERAIKDYSLRGDPSVFDQVDCGCRRTWRAVCDRETGFAQPLAA